MKDWYKYWQKEPLKTSETDFFGQVGKTCNKEPISQEQLNTIITNIVDALDIGKGDTLVDLCCGNGLITNEISKYSGNIIGMDYSETLIKNARKYFAKDNIEYFTGDVVDIGSVVGASKGFKFYMYEALQHFNAHKFGAILENLVILSKGDLKLYLGSVPDKRNIWRFYNTFGRKARWLWQSVIKNHDPIGTWWTEDGVASICREHGLSMRVIPQNRMLHTAHYRMDILVFSKANTDDAHV